MRLKVTPVPLPTPAPDIQAAQSAEAAESIATPVSRYVPPVKGTFRAQEFYSAALDRDMSYFIYLPPRYSTEGRRYPVLFMLHGAAGDKSEWPALGLVDAVDTLIDSKELRPMIVVMPEGEFSYFINHINGGPRWADYIAEDLVRHISSSYRTLPDPEHRAIGGLSMGAFGALSIAFTHTDVFGAVGAHSPSIRTEEDLKSIAGEGEQYAKIDPINLAYDAPGVEDLNIWIDIGDEDPWLERAEELHTALEERGVNHEWNVMPGGHEGEYWTRNLVTYLRYYDRVLSWHDAP
jgi:enterochelin esterase-like enzyme